MSKQEKLSAGEKLLRSMRAIMKHHNKESMSETIKKGMLQQVKKGYAVSRPPMGYSSNNTPGHFEVNRFGTILREELKTLARGNTTIKSVASRLALTFDPFDFETEPWSKAKIKRLMSDPYYAGWISYKGQLYLGLHEPLINEKEHQKLLTLIANKDKCPNSLKSVDKSL